MRDPLEQLRALVVPLGGRADRLADGSLIASWLAPGVPRDQAARAARAALLARTRLPGAAITLTSGMTAVRGALPLGPALDRAVALLDAAQPPDGAVPIDQITAGLLDVASKSCIPEARFTSSPSALQTRRRSACCLAGPSPVSAATGSCAH